MNDTKRREDTMSNGKIEVHGVKGMSSKPFRKTFASEAAMEKWLAKNDGDVEVHGIREAD